MDLVAFAFLAVLLVLVVAYMRWAVRAVQQARAERDRYHRQLMRLVVEHHQLERDHESLVAHAFVREGRRYVAVSRWPVM